MTDHIAVDVPILPVPEEVDVKRIKWCEGHWAQLMFALKDRGLENRIAESPEELSTKLANGEEDACWEACSMINVGAFEIFGAEKIIHENGGCPVCAFSNIIQHVADLMAQKFGATH